MSRPLRAGVIGAGAMGRNHVRVYSELESVELVGVADPNAATARSAARRYRVPHYDRYIDLLEDASPDLVSVAAPTSLHHAVVMDCLARGVHVLVEKPIAATIEEGRAMIDVARRQGALLTVGHIERFNPAVLALKARLDAGALGRIFMAAARRVGPFPARISDVGVVVDLATHDLDIMRFLLGSEVTRVQAEIAQRVHTAHEDMLSAMLRFDNGCIGVLDINWVTPTKVRDLTITGERGMFHVNYLTQELTFFENRLTSGGWDTLNVLTGVSEGNATRLSIERREPLLAELEAFVRAVRDGGGPPVAPEDALAALTLALTTLHAGEAGSPVTISAGPSGEAIPHGRPG
ncbi:MAG: Gfo/Idh/MocA family oxidoreductase [Anaerolineae bacterium]